MNRKLDQIFSTSLSCVSAWHSACVTNEEVRAKIQQAIGPHEDLLTMVKRRKLQWYGHVSRSSGLAKTILQGTVKGGRRQRRQKKRWEDNIREWTGVELAKSQKAVENREKWRKLDVKSSVVPQWPSRLRDRWWWWKTVVKKTCSLSSYSGSAAPRLVWFRQLGQRRSICVNVNRLWLGREFFVQRTYQTGTPVKTERCSFCGFF